MIRSVASNNVTLIVEVITRQDGGIGSFRVWASEEIISEASDGK